MPHRAACLPCVASQERRRRPHQSLQSTLWYLVNIPNIFSQTLLLASLQCIFRHFEPAENSPKKNSMSFAQLSLFLINLKRIHATHLGNFGESGKKKSESIIRIISTSHNTSLTNSNQTWYFSSHLN